MIMMVIHAVSAHVLMPSVNTWPPSKFLPSLPCLCSKFPLAEDSIPRPAVSRVQITEVLKTLDGFLQCIVLI
jgi:hypothetical protein